MKAQVTAMSMSADDGCLYGEVKFIRAGDYFIAMTPDASDLPDDIRAALRVRRP